MQLPTCKVVFLLPLILQALSGCNPAAPSPSLKVYCAAVMRKPMETLAEKYRQETGTQIELQFGGSNTLLSQASISGSGDLYLAADQSYIDAALQEDLVEDVYPVAVITPVVVTAKKSGIEVDSVEYLVLGSPRIVLPDPDTAAIGLVTKQALQKCGMWDKVAQQVQTNGVYKATVGYVAGDVALGSADVGIVWDTIGKQIPSLRCFHLPELDPWKSTISIAVLKSASDRQQANDFARFLGTSPTAKQELSRLGFQTIVSPDEEISHE